MKLEEWVQWHWKWHCNVQKCSLVSVRLCSFFFGVSKLVLKINLVQRNYCILWLNNDGSLTYKCQYQTFKKIFIVKNLDLYSNHFWLTKVKTPQQTTLYVAMYLRNHKFSLKCDSDKINVLQATENSTNVVTIFFFIKSKGGSKIRKPWQFKKARSFIEMLIKRQSLYEDKKDYVIKSM